MQYVIRKAGTVRQVCDELHNEAVSAALKAGDGRLPAELAQRLATPASVASYGDGWKAAIGAARAYLSRIGWDDGALEDFDERMAEQADC